LGTATRRLEGVREEQRVNEENENRKKRVLRKTSGFDQRTEERKRKEK